MAKTGVLSVDAYNHPHIGKKPAQNHASVWFCLFLILSATVFFTGCTTERGRLGPAGATGTPGAVGPSGAGNMTMNLTPNMTAGTPMVNNLTPTINLGSGSASSTTYLRGDQTWATPAGGSGLGYTLSFSHHTTSPADNVKNYWGMDPLAPSTTAAVRKVPVPATGTIKEIHVATNSGTAGTAEPWSLYVYKNGVINNSTGFVKTNSVSASIRLWDNTTMNMPVTKGDYLEMCFVNPTWVTNPLTTVSNGYVYIE